VIVLDGARPPAAITFFINGNHDIALFRKIVFDIVRDYR